MTEAELYALVHRANASPLGIIVSDPEPARLRQRLYPIMKSTGISLSLRLPRDGNLWLVKPTALTAG